MPHNVYVIRNDDGDLYIGMSTNFNRRLKQHRAGKSPATAKGNLNWIALHTWFTPDFESMSRMERYLQKYQSERGNVALYDFINQHPTFDEEIKYLLHSMDASLSDLKQFSFPWNNLINKKRSFEAHTIAVKIAPSVEKYIVVEDNDETRKYAAELKASKNAALNARRKISNRLKVKI